MIIAEKPAHDGHNPATITGSGHGPPTQTVGLARVAAGQHVRRSPMAR